MNSNVLSSTHIHCPAAWLTGRLGPTHKQFLRILWESLKHSDVISARICLQTEQKSGLNLVLL